MMIKYLHSMKSEMKKQYKLMLSSNKAMVLMTLYPILEFCVLYGRYLPFKSKALNSTLSNQIGTPDYFSFFLVGYIGLMLFQSVMWTGWFYSKERVMGTLEIAYMSPASKLGLITGNAIIGIVKNAWMSVIFAVLMMMFLPSDIHISSSSIALIIPILVIPSVCWGTFVNSLMMFSRNGFTILNVLMTPLGLLSGTEIPVSIFPSWLQPITLIIPLTWSLSSVRKIVLNGATFSNVSGEIAILAIISVSLMVLANIVCKKAEKYLKKTGSLTLF